MNGSVIWVAVALGGAIGAVARFAVSRISMQVLGPNFPWGTLGVNIIGSFAMGLLITWFAAKEPTSPAMRAFLTVGILGAFTTFSTFSLDVVTLYRDRTIFDAGGYLLASVVLSISGLLLGLVLGRQLS